MAQALYWGFTKGNYSLQILHDQHLDKSELTFTHQHSTRSRNSWFKPKIKRRSQVIVIDYDLG